MYQRKVSCILALSILLITTWGCNVSQEQTPAKSTNGEITFTAGKVISFQYITLSCFYFWKEYAAQIWVITDRQQYNRPKGVELVSTDPPRYEPPTELTNFDFSKNFIILVFNGRRGGYGIGMKVENLSQDKDTIYILGRLDDPGGTVIPIVSSQYNVLAISKEQMTQFGEITFKLLDQSGKERATTTYEILQ